jgi:MtN3 and saliva related transmembrane protein
MDLTTAIGGFAAACTSLSYLPQLRKCWATGSAGDFSLKTFAVLAAGVTSVNTAAFATTRGHSE